MYYIKFYILCILALIYGIFGYKKGLEKIKKLVMKKIISKGYTLTVTSWENDGDNYNTKSITVDSKEKAKAYYDMMQLCTSKNQSKGGVKLGNTYGDFSEKQKQLIIDFLRANPIVLEGDDVENADDDQLLDWFGDVSFDLLGSSENYACRVMEKCVVTYSPEDVFLEEVKF